MKLKLQPHDHALCAAARCKAEATHTDSTGYLAVGNVPLCDAHWSQRLDEEDGTAERPAGRPRRSQLGARAGSDEGASAPHPGLATDKPQEDADNG